MKNKCKWLGIIALVAIIVFSITGCDEVNGNGEKPTTYTITYNGNEHTGGTVPTDNTPYPSGASVTVLGNQGNLVKTGHSFAGWNAAANGSGASYNAGSVFTIYANTILYAQWTPTGTVPCTVTYNGNTNTGGTVPIDSNSPYQNGDTVTVLGNTGNLVKTGHTFAGWNTVAGGSGTPYTAGANFTIGTNTILYAQWTPDGGGNECECSDPCIIPNCNCLDCPDNGNVDTLNWTAVTNSTFDTRQINGIAWGNNKFVAVGDPTLNFSYMTWSGIAYSSDGINWTPVADSKGSGEIMAVVWGSDKFVAVGRNSSVGQNGLIRYSSDGIIWTAVANSNFGSEVINGIAYGNNKFVAVGRDGKIAYSSDGISWTAVADSTFDTSVIHSIAWGNNRFVAVGQHGKMAYSSDGITWTAITNSTFGSLRCIGITWGNNMFVAVGESGRIAYSSDGISWTAVTNSTFPSGDNAVRGIAWGNNMFVAGNRGQLSYSFDGITWTAFLESTFGSSNINFIAWGNNKFVAVGNDGKMAYSSGN